MLLSSLIIYCHSNSLLLNYCAQLLACCHYKVSFSLRGERLILKKEKAIYLSVFEIMISLKKKDNYLCKNKSIFKIKFEVFFFEKIDFKN